MWGRGGKEHSDFKWVVKVGFSEKVVHDRIWYFIKENNLGSQVLWH